MFSQMGKDGNEEGLPSWLQEENNNNNKKNKTKSKTPKRRFMRNRNNNTTTPSATNHGAVVDYGEEDIGGGGGVPPMPFESPPSPPTAAATTTKSTYGAIGDVESNEPGWVHSERQQTDTVNDDDDDDESSEEDSSSGEEDDSDEESSDEDSDEEESSEEESSEEEEDSENDQLINPTWSKDDNDKTTKKKRRDKKTKRSTSNNNNSNNTTNKKKVPLRTCCHSFFILIQGIAIISNFAMIAIQLIPIYIWPTTISIIQKVVRYYIAFFNLTLILAELDVIQSLKNWISRGLIYTFLGVIALDQRYTMIKYGFLNVKAKTNTNFGDTWNELWTSIFIEIGSWVIIGIGCTYVFLEIICMRRYRDHCRLEYQKRVMNYENENDKIQEKKKRKK
jgi:hypothetical protein